jgi:hypothetical protein
MKNENNFFWKLRRNIKEFEDLDNELYSYMKLGNMEYLARVLKAKKNIKRLLSEEEVIHIGPDKALADKLKKIRDDYGYNIDLLIDNINNYCGSDISQSSEDDKDYVDALFSEGTADYVDEKFFQRKNEIGAVICNQSLPDIFLYHIARLKECYSLGLFDSTIIYCRAVIESCAYIFLCKKGQISTDKKITDIGEYSLKELLLRIKPYTNSSIQQEVAKVISLANRVLHEKRKSVSVTNIDAYNSVKSTFDFIEILFK